MKCRVSGNKLKVYSEKSESFLGSGDFIGDRLYAYGVYSSEAAVFEFKRGAWKQTNLVQFGTEFNLGILQYLQKQYPQGRIHKTRLPRISS